MSVVALRLRFADETFMRRLTSSAPPAVLLPDGAIFEEEGARIGQSMSGELLTLVGGIHAWGASYSPRHPLRRALVDWERLCRRKHRGLKWLDHASRPLCSDLLRGHVERSETLFYLASATGVSYPRAERLLRAGLEFVEDRLCEADDERLGVLHNRAICATKRAELA